jgi:hypothetical protein
VSLQDSVKVQALYVLILGHPCYTELKLLSPAKAKEKALKALSARKLMERSWLSALLGYLVKRDELKVRLKYIGDVTLLRTDFEALAANAYYTAKCCPQLPTELARAAGSLLKPQEGPLWLVKTLSQPLTCAISHEA